MRAPAVVRSGTGRPRAVVAKARAALDGWRGDGDPRWRAWAARRVYLTFDDGPDPRWTPLVLDELARAGARATFFVIGEKARGDLGLLERARAEGHDVELHCMRHVRHTLQTRAEVERDTDDALEVLAAAGIRPTRWRVPYNVAECWSEEVAAARGLRIVGGSADPRDWSGADVPELLAEVDRDLRPGRVVVMHDGLEPGAARSSAANTVALVAPLVERIRARRLRPAPLSEGPAFWWTRTMPRMASEVVEIIDEEDLAEADATAVRTLLTRTMTRFGDDYAAKGWRRIRPSFRAVARVGGEIVATTSMMPLANDAGLVVFGSGDSAVRSDHQGAGLGQTIVRSAIRECRRRGADAILGDTTALARLAAAEGWRRVRRFEVFYERDGACHWHPQWWVWEREPLPGRLQLEEGDF